MENRVMEPIIDEVLSHVFPPLPLMDEMLLAESIKENGVIHPLIIWKGKGILVDGHNRFKICKELGLPYSTQEMDFADANAAKTWMIKNQLGRRNVNAFVKVELVLPLRDSLLEEGRKNHGRPKKGEKTLSTMIKFSAEVNTQKSLAELSGVSTGTFYKSQWLVGNATESIKEMLRVGAISISSAYMMTKWLLNDADEFTRRKVESGEMTLEQAYENARKEQGNKDDGLILQDVTEPVSEGDDDQITRHVAESIALPRETCADDQSLNSVTNRLTARSSARLAPLSDVQQTPQHYAQPTGATQVSSDQKIVPFAPRQQPNWCIDDYVDEPDDYVPPQVPYVRHDPDDIPLEQRNINLGPLTGPHSTSKIDDDELDIDPFDYTDFDDWEEVLIRKVDNFTYYVQEMLSKLSTIELPPNAGKRITAILDEFTTKVNEKYEEVFENEEE